MLIKSARFLISNTDISKCPPAKLPEYAFIGRSNVGKSSLINMLTGRNDLAKISSKPGKTQLINHFIINDEWYLVDLPGYGFASVSKEKQQGFKELISDYILKRENLFCVFVLIDSRLVPQAIDSEFMEWLNKSGIAFVIVFTKTDKLSKTELEKNTIHYQNELLKTWEELPQIFYSSAVKNIGKSEILKFIESANQLFYSNQK